MESNGFLRQLPENRFQSFLPCIEFKPNHLFSFIDIPDDSKERNHCPTTLSGEISLEGIGIEFSLDHFDDDPLVHGARKRLQYIHLL